MKKIPNYENYYIDEEGNVFNSNTNTYLKGSISEHGYRYYRLSKDNKKKVFYAHRLVAENYLNDTQSELKCIVNHKDGNKLNNNIDNLEWVTYSENVKHAHDNNLIKLPTQREYYTGDLEGEIWKPLFELPYSISSCGRARNDRTNLILKPSKACGYDKIRPCLGGISYDILIHKAVYCAFNNIQEIPSGYIIDHIDGNKSNNNINNLRLVTNSENTLAAYYLQQTNKSCKEVKQFDLMGNYITTFPSVKEAARQLNLDSSTISKVCRGKNKTHGGFIFKYSENFNDYPETVSEEK